MQKQDEAEKAEVEENNLPESPAEETNLSETETEVEEVATESTPEPEVEDKKSASYRIKELNEEKKLAVEKAKSLEDKLAELTGRVSTGGEPQYVPQVPEQTRPEPQVDEYGNQVIDPVKYKEDILRETQTRIDLHLARERNFERINNEAQKTVKKYSQLNPDSDEFDKDLSDAVGKATEAYLKSNPLGSVTEFVGDMMKPYLRSIDNEVGKQREEITKQASQSALRPTQVPKGETPFGELSLEEMEARLGGVKR